jgi:hypothetical protein
VTPLDLSLGLAAGLLLAGVAGWCVILVFRYDLRWSNWRSVSRITLAAWLVGYLLVAAALLTLVGAILGGAARAGWLLLGGR